MSNGAKTIEGKQVEGISGKNVKAPVPKRRCYYHFFTYLLQVTMWLAFLLLALKMLVHMVAPGELTEFINLPITISWIVKQVSLVCCADLGPRFPLI